MCGREKERARMREGVRVRRVRVKKNVQNFCCHTGFHYVKIQYEGSLFYTIRQVHVPVQMSVHDPRVSIISSFFTNTLCVPILSATMNRQAVTVVGRP